MGPFALALTIENSKGWQALSLPAFALERSDATRESRTVVRSGQRKREKGVPNLEHGFVLFKLGIPLVM